MTSRVTLSARLAELLSPDSPEELERRRAHLFGLLLVAIVGTAKHVTGLTDGSAQYTIYILAIALTAVSGGIAPACTATLAAIVLAGAGGSSGLGSAGAIAFALEGLLVAALVGTATRRRRETAARLDDAIATNTVLSRQVQRGRIAQDAFEHLEDTAADAAVFTVNAQGLIIDWPRSAGRMYGFSAEDMLGSNFADVIGEASRPGILPHLFTGPERNAPLVGVHRRSDGTPLHVAFDVRRCGPHAADHVTVAVHDLSRRREADAFREAAIRAQTALQHAADEAQSRLETLEALTDPSISLIPGSGAIEELLGRLRSAVRAEGVALVAVGRTTSRLHGSAGLRPAVAVGSLASATSGADGRIAIVHNDPGRVAQVSALVWAPTVSSILVVPVCVSGTAAFRIEIVNERRARASEWDLALARIVADRLAPAMLRRTADSAGAVA
jgi:PAS domain S-box-containing protein